MSMENAVATLESDALLRNYRAAVVAFNVATAPLMHHLAATTLPSEQQISAEENARVALVAARRRVWNDYGRRRR
jgi:hypothetical protein